MKRRLKRPLASLRSSLIAAVAVAVAVLVMTTLLIADPIVEWSAPPAALAASHAAVREVLILAGAVALAVGVMLTFVLSRTIVEPIRMLTDAADSLATGDLSKRIHSPRQDELGILGAALDGMADRLEAQMRTLRTEEERLRAVLDAMIEAVFVTDQEKKVALNNRALTSLLGADVMHQAVRDAIPFPVLRSALREARESGQAHKVALEIERDGQTRFLQAQLAPLPAKSGVVVVLHDVTEIKRADAIRRDFVANASHELRTPLTAVRGYTETLLDGAIDDPQSARRFVEVILRHTLRLQRLVEDLLSLSRLEAPHLHLACEALPAERVAREVVDSLQGQAEAKDLQLVLHPPAPELPMVLANEDALHEILINLVDNAIKYTPEGGRIDLEVQHEPPDRVVLRVRDNGHGVEQAHQGRIFERFYRVDAARSRDVGGTGLGLAIVKHLASRMDGEVGLDSAVGQGSTFWLRLQAA